MGWCHSDLTCRVKTELRVSAGAIIHRSYKHMSQPEGWLNEVRQTGIDDLLVSAFFRLFVFYFGWLVWLDGIFIGNRLISYLSLL